MNTKMLLPLALSALFSLPLARAHCDTLDGPVVVAARAALDSGKLNLVLAWVPPTAKPRSRRPSPRPAPPARPARRPARSLTDGSSRPWCASIARARARLTPGSSRLERWSRPSRWWIRRLPGATRRRSTRSCERRSMVVSMLAGAARGREGARRRGGGRPPLGGRLRPVRALGGGGAHRRGGAGHARPTRSGRVCKRGG